MSVSVNLSPEEVVAKYCWVNLNYKFSRKGKKLLDYPDINPEDVKTCYDLTVLIGSQNTIDSCPVDCCLECCYYSNYVTSKTKGRDQLKVKHQCEGAYKFQCSTPWKPKKCEEECSVLLKRTIGTPIDKKRNITKVSAVINQSIRQQSKPTNDNVDNNKKKKIFINW